MQDIALLIILLTAGASIYAWNNPSVYAKWVFNPYRVQKDREYHRFLMSGLIHVDALHLILNMITFMFFAPVMMKHFAVIYGNLPGILLFIALYFLGIIAADIPTFYKQRHNPHYSAVGASGGVSAVVFAGILFSPTQSICLWGILCLPGFLLGGLYLIYTYTQSKQGGMNINHDAHLYGALFGMAFSILTYPMVIPEFFYQMAQWQPF